MANLDGEAQLLGQFLEFNFPQPHSRTIAAAAIGHDLQALWLRIKRRSHRFPPTPDGFDGKGSRVMVNPDTDPPEISRQVVDAVGYRAAQFLDQEVMDPDLFRIALQAILTAWVAEIPDLFLFLVPTAITGCCSARAAATWVLT